MPRPAPFVLLASLLSGCTAAAAPPEGGPPDPATVPTAAETARARAANALLAKSINLGNALEAPREGLWGYEIEERHLDAIKNAGFTAVRLPVKWTAHAGETAPYTIDPRFFARIDEVLNWALDRRLAVVLNCHHFDEIHEDPSEANLARLVGIWEQIARRYQNRPAALLFEPLNEPSLELSTTRWSGMFPRVLAAIRTTNPTRAVLVGPGNWNQIQELKDLALPPDPDLILTVHCYEPYEFTHQGATWNENPPPVGRPFPKAGEEAELRDFLDVCRRWATARNRPVFVGEFGVIRHAAPADRARWTRFMRTGFENRGWSWAYWDFAAEFKAYETDERRWIEAMRAALLD